MNKTNNNSNNNNKSPNNLLNCVVLLEQTVVWYQQKFSAWILETEKLGGKNLQFKISTVQKKHCFFRVNDVDRNTCMVESLATLVSYKYSLSILSKLSFDTVMTMKSPLLP